MLNIANLQKIYSFIEALPEHKVDMGAWRFAADREGEITNEALRNECGTAACIVGWLPVIFGTEQPRVFEFEDFAQAVSCKTEEAFEVCRVPDRDEVFRTKADALASMEKLALAYATTLR